MLEQDEDLVDVIRELRQEKGEGKSFKPRRLAEKIEVIGPSIALQELRRAVSVAVVDRLGINWDEMYGCLLAYVEEHREARVPAGHVTNDGRKLGRWIVNQRSRRDGLSLNRQQQLERLRGWTWDHLSEAWENGYRSLKAYSEESGNVRVPQDLVTRNGFRLGQWVSVQRLSRESMPMERRIRLEHLNGWSWDGRDAAWEEGFIQLQRYCDEKSNALVPQDLVTRNGFRLGQWVSVQRLSRESMPMERRIRLEHLNGWSWDGRDAAWEEGFIQLQRYCDEKRSSRVPLDYRTKEGFKLGAWVNTQRAKEDRLSPDRRIRLEKLAAWSYAPFSDAWDLGYQHLLRFITENGHGRVPAKYETSQGFKLGRWVANQRHLGNRKKMPDERRRRLDSLKGWVWNTI